MSQFLISVMIWYIIWFLIGTIVGSLGTWIYGELTDKVKLAKMGYGLGKIFVLWIINKININCGKEKENKEEKDRKCDASRKGKA